MNEVMKIERVRERDSKIIDATESPTSLADTKQKLDMETAKEQALIKTMMEKEAQLQRLTEKNKRLKKENNYIKHSRTWKIAAPIRKLTQLFNLFRSHTNRELETENQTLKTEVRKI